MITIFPKLTIDGERVSISERLPEAASPLLGDRSDHRVVVGRLDREFLVLTATQHAATRSVNLEDLVSVAVEHVETRGHATAPLTDHSEHTHRRGLDDAFLLAAADAREQSTASAAAALELAFD